MDSTLEIDTEKQIKLYLIHNTTKVSTLKEFSQLKPKSNPPVDH